MIRRVAVVCCLALVVLVLQGSSPSSASTRAYVVGGVRALATQADVVLPFPDLAVTPAATTDLGGGYVYGGTTTTTALDGPHISITDSCGAPTGTSDASGQVDLGTGGADCTFGAPGHSTAAARTAFYYAGIARQLANGWLGGGVNAKATAWFASKLTANVNIAQTCNAYWSGTTINLFRSGNGCANSGEQWDVVAYEYGEGLDYNTKSGSVGDSAKVHALADVFAAVLTHDPCIGRNFLPGGGGETAACPHAIRDLRYVVTVSNIGTKCSKSSGDAGALGYEAHCESHILSGALYTLATQFVARYGLEDGWHEFERVFLRALQNTTAYLSSSAGSSYQAMLAADDDNGTVGDGTPNADLIYAAYNAQGIAPGGPPPVRNVVACAARPGAPSVTATTDSGDVQLSWPAVTGATSYNVLRDLVSDESQAYLPIATGVTSPYTDTQVHRGSDYAYQVVAVAGACRSPLGAPTRATPGNHAPSANDQNVATTSGSSVAITLTASDADGDAVTYELGTTPGHGTLTGTPPNLIYTPAAGYAGPDDFAFRVTDTHAASMTATVSITVSDVTAPSVTAPKPVLTVKKQLGTKAVPLTIVWTGTDNVTPPASLQYELSQRVGSSASTLGSWTVVRPFATGASFTKPVAPGFVQFRVRAKDAAGNIGGDATGPVRHVVAIQENAVKPGTANPAINYQGVWSRVARTGAYGGSVQTTNAAGATAAYAFTGVTSVGVVMPTRSGLGTVRICLDPGTATESCSGTITLNASPGVERLQLWTRSALTTGATHRVVVSRVSGRIDLDAFTLLSTP